MAEGGRLIFNKEFTNGQLVEWLRQKLGSEFNFQSFEGECQIRYISIMCLVTYEPSNLRVWQLYVSKERKKIEK